MAHQIKSDIKNPVINWIDARMPIFTMLQKEYGSFPTPKNFNYLWNFGALAMFMLVMMILTGIFLAMNYTADTNMAFDSVEHIMRDVNYGWLIRYLHMNGASMFFIVVYVHIFRGMYYGSYKKPRELLWMLGVIILLLMMATAFMGYVLPWGQMSFWGATVITNLFSAIPVVGPKVVTWLWGGFSVDNPTLTRFYALHYLLPFVICAVVFLHVVALHVTGSNNPLGIDPKGPQDTVPFHPYYTSKDIFGLGVFMIFYALIVFYAPNYLGHPDNYIEANPMATPAHIVPEWYFLPFYAMLRSITFDIGIPFTHITLITSKLMGVILMFGSIAVLFVLPWLDRSPVRSALFRPLYRKFFWLHGIDCVVLGFVGANPPEGWWVIVGEIATFWYFFHFFVVLPFLLPRFEKTEPLPNSIAESVLKKRVLIGAILLACLFGMGTQNASAQETQEPKHIDWQHGGLFGTFDRAQLQRGFQVYKEVCSNCHAMHLLAYRNLMDLGFSADEVKAIAAQYQVQDGPNDQGDMFQRPGKPSDRFHSPFANPQAAMAALGGALPKDLSLIVKAREGGEDYIYSLLTGFDEKPPAGFNVPAGLYYNPYFAGNLIAMPAPLSDGQVTYADGTKATVDQMARDVVSFLTWAAEPNLEARKQMGVKVILFLLAFTCIMYGVKRKVWSNVKH